MVNTITDENIYLRIRELKKGNIQLTDSINASRFIREHERDIRYNATCKRWIV